MFNNFCSISLNGYPNQFVRFLKAWQGVAYRSYSDDYGGAETRNAFVQLYGKNYYEVLNDINNLPKYFNGYERYIIKDYADLTNDFLHEMGIGLLEKNYDFSRVRDQKLRQLLFELFLINKRNYFNYVPIFTNYELSNFSYEIIGEDGVYYVKLLKFKYKINLNYDRNNKLWIGYKYLYNPIEFHYDFYNTNSEDEYIKNYGNGITDYQVTVFIPKNGNYLFYVYLRLNADDTWYLFQDYN